jgi:hypothetical protein
MCIEYFYLFIYVTYLGTFSVKLNVTTGVLVNDQLQSMSKETLVA